MSAHRLPADLQLAEFGATWQIGNKNIGVILAGGPTVPTDGAAGYKTACAFFQTDATTLNTCMYLNIGTLASCNFDAMTA